MTLSGLYKHSPADHPPLRVAVLFADLVVPRFHAATLDDLKHSDFVELVLVVVPSLAPREAVSPYVPDAETPKADPGERVDVTALIEGVPQLATGDALRAEAVAQQLRACELDVILCLGAGPDVLQWKDAARFGIWAYDYGAGPAQPTEFLEEMVDPNALSLTASLKAITPEQPGGATLCRGIFPLRSRVSPAQARFAALWGSQFYVIWKLNQLHQHGWGFLKAQCVQEPGAVQKQSAPLQLKGKLAITYVRRGAARLMQPKPKIQDWYIGLRTGRTPLAGSATDDEIREFTWLQNPKDRFYADPCLFKAEGKTWLFFEDYDFQAGFAGLSVAPVASAENREHVSPVLNLPCHLSYPMVFEHGGEVFLMPESSAMRNVQLYRCVRFPYEWKLEKVLFAGLPLVDTTPLLHEGVWYFFTAVEEPINNVNTGLLFTATSLTAPWRLHPASPDSLDVRTCRPAGAIVREGNRLFRPTQDCLRWYGYGFQINEITRLNEREVEQRVLTVAGPDRLPGMQGTHTYHRVDDVEVIDGLRYVARSAVSVERRP